MSSSVRLLPVAVSIFVFLSAGSESAAAKPSKASGPSYSLRSARRADAVDRVATVLEVTGVLQSPHKGKIERSKMNVEARVVYDERTLEVPDGPGGPLRSVRHYDEAEAAIKLAKRKLTPELRPKRRLMAVEIDQAKITLFSPRGRLTRDELDLVDLPANSLLLDRFLPGQPVAQGDAWEHDDDLILATLGLERLTKNTVRSTLEEVNAKWATISMSGRVEGATGGVTSRTEVKGKYRFNRKTRRIDWFGLLVHEDRDVGHIAPGLEVVARLRMQIAPASEKSTERLSGAAFDDLPLRPSGELTQLVYEPRDGGWRFEHDRRWFLTGDDRRLAFFRFVDRGDFIAQCNVAAVGPVKPGKQATLEQFQKDIQTALGEGFGEFVSAGQKANDQDYRVLRVVVRGTSSGLPIEWHYYLVADEHGRQVAFTFTVEGPLAERLGDLDRQIVASLRFDKPEVALSSRQRAVGSGQ